jgi:hypothetical protein
MLRREDLRVGNRVKILWKSGIELPTDGEVKVHELREHCAILIDTQGIKTSRPYEFLAAIEITEDILLEIGAHDRTYADFPSYHLRGMQLNFIENDWLDYVYRVRIKGLHHLQNIFYFAKSQELIKD